MKEINLIIEECAKLKDKILQGKIERYKNGWGGADVSISKDPKPTPKEDSFYPPPSVYVQSKYAPQIGWIFNELKDIFSPILDSINKYVFFDRLAKSILDYQSSLGSKDEENLQDLLVSILEEAVNLARNAKNIQDWLEV